jgi:hypothetical protein
VVDLFIRIYILRDYIATAKYNTLDELISDTHQMQR